VTLLQGLFRARAPRAASLELPSTPLTSTALLEWLGGAPLDAGVAVTPYSSMTMSAVWRAVSVTSGVASALPLHGYARGTKDRREYPLIDDPHPEMTPLELWRLSYAHRLLWGDFVAQKLRTPLGEVKELWPVTPNRVMDIRRVKPSAANPGGKEFDIVDDGGTLHKGLTTRQIFHIPGLSLDGVRGMSVISYAAQGIGLGLAAEKSAARFFGRGAQLSGVLETDQRLEQQQADTLKERWQVKVGGLENAHEIAVLDSGAKFRPLTMPYRDAQLLESRRFEVNEIARFYGVPLFLMFETEKSTSWGTGLEQQALGWIVFDLNPQWLAPTEQRITKELLPADAYARYSLQGLMRGDSAARANFYRVMREVGALNADEIRDLEDRPPIPGSAGEQYLQPGNMLPLGTEPDDEPAPPPVPDEDDDQEPDDV
jgi:HK97 family phage portal protein